MIKELSDMLNSKYPLYAEVNMPKMTMKLAVVERLRDHLFSDEFANRWYYAAEEWQEVRVTSFMLEI
jgi:hypothetical protein